MEVTAVPHPEPYYCPHSDAVEFFVHGKGATYAVPVNPWLSVYYQQGTDRVTGFRIEDVAALRRWCKEQRKAKSEDELWERRGESR
jgi:hypothetical protein